MFGWLYDVPFWLGALLFIVALVGITWLAIPISRRYVKRIVVREPEWDRTVGLMLSAYGVFYGITLALIAVSAYNNYSRADLTASQEAAALGTLYREMSSYPEPTRSQLTGMVRDYTDQVIGVEWPEQQKGEPPTIGNGSVTAIQDLLYGFEPQTSGETVLHSATVYQFGVFIDLRRQRLSAVTLGLPSPLWFRGLHRGAAQRDPHRAVRHPAAQRAPADIGPAVDVRRVAAVRHRLAGPSVPRGRWA